MVQFHRLCVYINRVLVSHLIFKDFVIDVLQSLLAIHLAARSWQLHY